MRKHTDSNPQTPYSESLTNIANALTGLRLLLAPVIAWTITQQFWFIATLGILVAIATDVYDGRVARRLGLTSPFGGFFDHGTDALFVSVSAWALAELGLITPWLWPCIAIAFLQYALDSKALAGQTLRTSLIGRYNGLGYYSLVATAIGTQALQQGLSDIVPRQAGGLAFVSVSVSVSDAITFLDCAVFWTAWLLVGTTLLSMADRLYHTFKRST